MLSRLAAVASAATVAYGQAPAPSYTAKAAIPGAVQERWWRGYMSAPRVRLPDGRRLTLFCEGKGAPVVILDIGLGGGAWGWATVQDEMARKTRVCSYDRAGYANSDPATTPRTFDALAADLSALLSAGGVKGPYVMVGQSLGGPIVGLFAQRHPQKVAGLVLIDPAVGNQVARMAAITPEADNTASRVAAARTCVRADARRTMAPCCPVRRSRRRASGPIGLASSRRPLPRQPTASGSAVQTCEQGWRRSKDSISQRCGGQRASAPTRLSSS